MCIYNLRLRAGLEVGSLRQHVVTFRYARIKHLSQCYGSANGNGVYTSLQQGITVNAVCCVVEKRYLCSLSFSLACCDYCGRCLPQNFLPPTLKDPTPPTHAFNLSANAYLFVVLILLRPSIFLCSLFLSAHTCVLHSLLPR